MFVENRFKLPEDIVDIQRKYPVKFGFNGFGEIVYYTNYSRRKSNGVQEQWVDTCRRVVEGAISIRKNWYLMHGLKWDEYYWTKEAVDLFFYIYTLKLLPPGRGLWAQNTNYVYSHGSMALNNCGASVVRNDSFAEDMGWIMDALMCGTGIGLRIFTNDFLRSLLYKASVFKKNSNKINVTIEDSREGWVNSVIILLKSYKWCREPYKEVIFDYDKIRELGKPIKGFGGTASGPTPLILLHNRICSFMINFIKGECNSVRTFSDIANSIGACIIAGNVRRSAEVILGDINDSVFLNLKNYNLNPEREEIGWMSNNTVCLEETSDFLKLDNIVESICNNGEPGILNVKNLQKYERYNIIGRPDKANMCNPCLSKDTPILVKNKGLIKIKDLSIEDLIWSKEGWTKVLAIYDNGLKDVYKYTTNSGTIYLTINHKILQNGIKTQIHEASSIDNLLGGFDDNIKINSQDIMDGLILGDGASLKQGVTNYLYIGKKDQDYFRSSVKHLIHNCVRLSKGVYRVDSTITRVELSRIDKRIIPLRFFNATKDTIAGFLKGLFTANGDISNDGKVGLRAVSRLLLEQVQIMLSSIGISSLMYFDFAHEVYFKSKKYLCKKSYKLRITKDIDKFYSIIGFLQNYKNEKLALIVKNKHKSINVKTIFKIKNIAFYAKERVYDITVSNKTHTFWAAGFNVANCGEVGLENKELCNLMELFPVRAKSKKEWLRMCELGTMYATSVSLLPTHDEQTNAVIARNRRIGISICGVSDWFDKWGAFKIVRFMRDGYSHIKETAKFYNEQAGVPIPIRITTVKPSGTVSQLAGVSPGMHFPIHKYAIRRMRISEMSPALTILQRAGIPIEDEVYNKGTKVIEYPIYTGTTRPVSEVSAWEQFSLLALLQREWSDNMVSCTINFKESEKLDLLRMLAHFIPLIKSVSLLPTRDNVYPQMPYEGISEDEYSKRVSCLKKIDWSDFEGSDGKENKYCSNDSCEI